MSPQVDTGINGQDRPAIHYPAYQMITIPEKGCQEESESKAVAGMGRNESELTSTTFNRMYHQRQRSIMAWSEPLKNFFEGMDRQLIGKGDQYDHSNQCEPGSFFLFTDK
jgi:hypothetical protein